MPGSPIEVYRLTRKKHDQLWNTYVMRPLAAAFVAAIHRTPLTPNQITILSLSIAVTGSALFVALPSYRGSLVAVLVLELAYLLDCADGMLARYKKLASPTGHLFDFFVDELKAVLLVAVIGIHLHRKGGLGIDGSLWPAGGPGFLYAAVAGAVIVASGISLTNFVRRPELTGKDTPTEAHYETVGEKKPQSIVGRVASLVMTFLRFLNHYPSHIWIFALADRLDLFFWMYLALNALYLARGWLGLLVRFGRT
ncbi:CDP-alcohol phosphatidyltransferase family protein [Polyangium sp. 15x6]|uniref:CDP-alcohol phosphatidyltransferase family protein n=1 Tax=Polyangium sp. 15x6 TaxID=3042687 RepID=UPI00249AE86D|nr:CDP-alcohol phosphatidyltransferase family protein [Polyangium sp. 15x6]MDI3290046.1 CDP-alcohol phosphatidyltransferase family protein [Polyangium sp. 15x6]